MVETHVSLSDTDHCLDLLRNILKKYIYYNFLTFSTFLTFCCSISLDLSTLELQNVFVHYNDFEMQNYFPIHVFSNNDPLPHDF